MLAGVIRREKPRWLFAPYWVDAHPDHLSIAAGTLDVHTGLVTASAWWTASASDYHRLDHDLVEYAREPLE